MAAVVTPADSSPTVRPLFPGRVRILGDQRGEVTVPADATTFEGFRRWLAGPDAPPERGRITFCLGEVTCDMSPEEIHTHASVKKAVMYGLLCWVEDEDRDLGEVYEDGVLVSNEAAGVFNEPDGIVCQWSTLESGKVVAKEWVEGSDRYMELTGTPDLVVEVVSENSVAKDTRRLRAAYFEAGISEYWIIDARGEQIVFELLAAREERYEAMSLGDDWHRSAVLGADVRLTRELRRGLVWRYKLDVRSS